MEPANTSHQWCRWSVIRVTEQKSAQVSRSVCSQATIRALKLAIRCCKYHWNSQSKLKLPLTFKLKYQRYVYFLSKACFGNYIGLDSLYWTWIYILDLNLYIISQLMMERMFFVEWRMSINTLYFLHSQNFEIGTYKHFTIRLYSRRTKYVV